MTFAFLGPAMEMVNTLDDDLMPTSSQMSGRMAWIDFQLFVGLLTGSVMDSISDPQFVAQRSVFWSGGEEAKYAAANWASANGGTTLEMTPVGQQLEGFTANWTHAGPLWESASAQFARDAIGDVHIFKGPAYSAGSIWNTIERPILEQNPNVRIIVH